MDKASERAVIQYLWQKGMSPQEIHEDMVQTLRGDSPSYAIVKRWWAEFNRGKTSVEDEARPARPTTATFTEMVQKIHDVVLDDRRVRKRHIANILGISQESSFGFDS